MHQTVSAPAPATLTVKQRRARRKKQIICGLIALVVLWIVGSIIWGKREKPIPVTTETAIRKTIVQMVSATGKIQPEVEVKISPEVADEITELPVDDGLRVKKGDLLVKIKPDSYKALLEQQEAAIAWQQKQIEALTAGLQRVSGQVEVSKPARRTVLNDQ